MYNSLDSITVCINSQLLRAANSHPDLLLCMCIFIRKSFTVLKEASRKRSTGAPEDKNDLKNNNNNKTHRFTKSQQKTFD